MFAVIKSMCSSQCVSTSASTPPKNVGEHGYIFLSKEQFMPLTH